jgi:hypothetical protein
MSTVVCTHRWSLTGWVQKTRTVYEVCAKCGARQDRPMTPEEAAPHA